MAPVSTLEHATFECARCGGTIDRSTHPRTCPHCQAKKADRCQLCDRAVYIGASRCHEHSAADPDRTAAMPPSAPPSAPAPIYPAPRWVATVARTAIAIGLLVPAGVVVRSQTQLRDADSFDDLRGMLPSGAPGLLDRVPDEQSGRGPLDFEKIVGEDIEGPAARQSLTEAGLLRGYGRAWREAGREDETLSVELYQYRDHAGAVMDEARAERLLPQLAASNGLSWTTFAVPTVPDAHGYRLVNPDGAVSLEVVTFTRGPYAAAVVVSSADREWARGAAVEVAEDQRARLSKAERIERLVVDAFRHLHD